ncbi:MAG TPA: [Fe-Fe] hydrogenase large subunit C-terminal domain-containing protein [Prolixibacteraceae bacterium]|nr:4Fe-4S binding protein [Bacteroidales bacterium]HPB05334.1 [Fe-Fe] hydrogenase large subunit C-terminal domain-containing protein [Prolixibacteraceae bacterium]HQN93141.1 [Fe-Fe] hydrogenase large subunit C-terminal domain-containing protein [Prolixibacteraceae bacterium]
MSSETFHHALYVDNEKCIRCTHCVKVCPTEAIRIVNAQVVIREDRCVDCGECMRACPHKAINIEHDDLGQIWKYKYRVLLFPSVFLGQFPEKITEDQIYASLLEIGFTHAYEVEQPIEVLKNKLREQIKNNKTEYPVISSFCPAIIRLIRIKYPSLTENISRVKAPHDLAAHWVLQKVFNRGIDPAEVGIFYITPCAAKITAVKSPLGEKESIITGIINPKQIYNKVMAIAEKVTPHDSSNMRKMLTKEGIQWSLTHGETWWQNAKCIAVDGIHNAIKFLERLENGNVPNVDFLEIRACDRSCAGGILLTQNRFLTVERLKNRAKKYPSSEKMIQFENYNFDELERKMITDEILPRPMLRFGSDMAKAINRMERARSIMCHLPGIDCAACGAPSCQALAEDMVNGQARMSDCIFIEQLWENDGKILPQKAFERMEKKWGVGRFDPDCSKKGAKNEGF